jgi:hypothetical protein
MSVSSEGGQGWANGRGWRDALVGCILWSTTASSSARLSRSISLRRRTLKAATFLLRFGQDGIVVALLASWWHRHVRTSDLPPGRRRIHGLVTPRRMRGRVPSQGVAAYGGGDVARAAEAQDRDDEVAQAGHDPGTAAGADLGGVLGIA